MRFLKYWDKAGIYALTFVAALFCWALLGDSFISSYNMLNVLMQISVSYTHLDVYKRQPTHSSARICSAI